MCEHCFLYVYCAFISEIIYLLGNFNLKYYNNLRYNHNMSQYILYLHVHTFSTKLGDVKMLLKNITMTLNLIILLLM